MKDIKYISSRLLAKPCFFLCLILNVTSGTGQENDTFIADTLENGFTYYIKPIKDSGEKVSMNLIIRSGYTRQLDGQFSLAHFVEHQPVKQFMNELYRDEGIFGSAIRSNDLFFNGGTSVDHTIYTFNYPSTEPVFTDKGVSFFSELVSGNKKLNRDFFEAEKGAFYQETAMPKIGNTPFKGQLIRAAYSNCFIEPVKPDSLWPHIKNYDIKETQEFLNTWYRPELSSLIIVGDIDNVSELQAKIKEKFSSKTKSAPILPNDCKETLSSNPPKFLVLKNQEFIPGSRAEVKFHFYIKEEQKNSGLSEIQWNYIKPFLGQFLNNYVWDNLGYYNSPTLPHINWSYYFPVLDIGIKTEVGKEEQSIYETFKLLSLLKYKGIAKEQWREIHAQGIESLKPPNTKSVNYWENRFEKIALGKEQLTEEKRENLLNWWKNFSNEDFNFSLRKLLDQDIQDFVIIAPISSQLNAIYWKDKTHTWLSKNGLNISNHNEVKEDATYVEQSRDIFGARVFLLSNGQKVVIKEFPKNMGDEEFISFHAFKNFGASHLNDEDYHTAMVAPELIQNSGYGELDKFDLSELKISNSIQKLNPYITDTESGIEAKFTGNDFTVFFELIEKYFNSPRMDSLAFKDWQTKNWHKYLNPGKSRELSDFNAQANKIMKVPRNELGVLEKYEAIKKVKMENAFKLYDSIFSGAHGFTFLIATSAKSEKILSQIEKRLIGKAGKKRSLKKAFHAGTLNSEITDDFIQIPSIPNANVIIQIKYFNELKNSDWKTRLHFQILAKLVKDRIPQIRFLKDKALYRYSVIFFDSKESNQAGISIVIPTLQEQAKSLSIDIQDIIEDLQQNEVTDVELKRIVDQKIIAKNVQDGQQNPSKTMETLYNYYRYDVIPPQKSAVERFIKTINPASIKAAANELLKDISKKEIIGVPNLNKT